MKVWNFTESLYGFAETYYEDNIQPLTGRYTQWASGVKSSMLDKIQKTIENYVPTVANQTFWAVKQKKSGQQNLQSDHSLSISLFADLIITDDCVIIQMTGVIDDDNRNKNVCTHHSSICLSPVTGFIK